MSNKTSGLLSVFHFLSTYSYSIQDEHGVWSGVKLHPPESNFEEMVIFSKTAVIFPGKFEVLVLAGIPLSVLTLAPTGPL